MKPIAITGIGCRLPGESDGPDAFWRNLRAGRDLICETPADRWNLDAYHASDPAAPGRTYARWGGFVAHPDEFDAGFFGISPREALRMDPQQRWLLETTWEALEDAGYPPAHLAGTDVGVYIGISGSDYGDVQKRSRYEVDAYTNSGNALSIAANRISCLFDFRGPSLAVDTACSSSLVALDLACRAIWHGDIAIAVVGGANALFTPDLTIGFSKASMLSPDGRCKSFDAAANGYVRAEGAACVVLRPLDQALAAGDRIYAVIRSTFVNQDGRTASMTVPSLDQQVELLRHAYRLAEVQPEQVGYVEAHGTGTPVGDPIEANALGQVLGCGRGGRPLWIGSVKSNLGHLEPASGITGLVKLALALHHRMIPPSLHFETANPQIAFDELGLKVATAPMSWEAAPGATALYGGVNSFGFGGTNAHAVLSSAPPCLDGVASTPLLPCCLWSVSARTGDALREAALRDAAFLRASNECFTDLAATAQTRRSHHPHRLAVVADDAGEAADRLAAWAEKRGTERSFAGAPRKQGNDVVFVFTGQGSQWPGMGWDLFQQVPLVRETIERFDALMQPMWKRSLVDVLQRRSDNVFNTDIGQPLLFALQVAIARLLDHLTVRPARVLGHSVGEIAAAHIAGLLGDEDAALLIIERSRAQERTRGAWAMAAVALTEDQGRRELATYNGAIEIAAVNTPTQLTVAGEVAQVEALSQDLSRRGVFARVLALPYAFHTRAMDPVKEEFLEAVRGLRAGTARVPFTSSVTGTDCEGHALGPDYWWRNLRQPVRFADAIGDAIGRGHRTFVEIGPHPLLVRYMRELLQGEGPEGAAIATLKRNEPGGQCIAETVAALHVRGVSIAWERLTPGDGRQRALPTYPWQRQRFWAESDDACAVRLSGPGHPLLGTRQPGPAAGWQADIGISTHPYLNDHALHGRAVFPGAGYVELMLAASVQESADVVVELTDVRFERVLWLEQSQLVETGLEEGGRTVTVSAKRASGSADWQPHARARVRTTHRTDASGECRTIPAGARALNLEVLYARFARAGHGYGPHFRTLRWAGTDGDDFWGRIALDPNLAHDAERFLLHPAVLDGAWQLTLASMPVDDEGDAMYLPIHIDRVRWYRRAGDEVVCRVSNIHHQDVHSYADIDLLDPAGEPIAVLLRCCCLKKERKFRLSASPAALYRERWEEAARPQVRQADLASWLVWDWTGQGRALAEAMKDGNGDTRRCTKEETPRYTEGVVIWAAGGSPATPSTLSVFDATWPLVQFAQRVCTDTAPVRIVLVTAGSTWGQSPEGPAPDLPQAALAGVLRTIATEVPHAKCTLIDLDPADPGEQGAQVLGDLALETSGSEVAYRAGRRFVQRIEMPSLEELRPRSLSMAARASVRFRLESAVPGSFDALTWVEFPEVTLADNEIEISVRAAGLNFRDVLKALGLYPLEPEEERRFGDECAGVVRRVGSAVTDFRTGDEVVAVAPGCFGSVARIDARLVVRKPQALTFEEAASLPIAFLTADFALSDVAKLQAGETVLVHSAAGGVGLAATQIACRLGATVLGTASPVKHDLLYSHGVAHAFRSRDLSFVEGVRAVTDGAGVDVVLNSLSGEFLAASLELVKPFGRFVEIGKKDIFANGSLDLYAFRGAISFHAVDLARVIAARPAWIGQRLAALFDRFDSGDLHPLPLTQFPSHQAQDAFRLMAHGKHRGKVVVTFGDAAIPATIHAADARPIRRDATYVITGGLTGFGWATAEWLVEQGATSLVLVSRSGVASNSAGEVIAGWRAAAIEVHQVRCDVTDAASVAALFASIKDTSMPIRGIFHSAMVLEDELLKSTTADAFARVLAPKVQGAWNLHQGAEALDLDHFVLYSSCATLLGSAAQASYVAANRFLEALAAFRRARGHPALAVGWGPLADFGVVSERPELARHLENVGLTALRREDVFGWLGFLLRRDVGCAYVLQADWAQYARACPAAVSERFAAMMASDAHAEHAGGLRELLAAAPATKRREILTTHLCRIVAGVLRSDEAAIDPHTSLTALGLDSLMAFEFKVKLDRELDLALPVDRLASDIGLAELADLLLAQLGNADAAEAKPVPLHESTPEPSVKRQPSITTRTPAEPAPFFCIVSQAAASSLESLPLDAAALTYLPDKLSTVGRLTDEAMSAMFGSEPWVSSYFETPFGRIAAITLPVRSKALFHGSEARGLIERGLDLAGRRGAHCVSLTGLIPSATDYGRMIESWRGERHGVRLTTGHATTTAAVVRTLQNMLRLTGREMQSERVAVLGLGSIGQSCVRLMLSVLPHPRTLVLADVFPKEDVLQEFARELAVQHGYQGPIQLVHVRGLVPDEVYDADTLLTAVSVPEALDVNRLRPGTLIVDDSYPPAFSLARAIERIEERGDILFSNAGMLRFAKPIHETFVLPAGAEAALQAFGVSEYRDEVVRDPCELTACILSSVLTDRLPGFNRTIGLATSEDLVSHYEALEAAGLTAARLQCENYFLPDASISRFADRFSRREQQVAAD